MNCHDDWTPIEMASRCFPSQSLAAVRCQLAAASAGRFREGHSAAVGQLQSVEGELCERLSGHSLRRLLVVLASTRSRKSLVDGQIRAQTRGRPHSLRFRSPLSSLPSATFAPHDAPAIVPHTVRAPIALRCQLRCIVQVASSSPSNA